MPRSASLHQEFYSIEELPIVGVDILPPGDDNA
jgi:hypothetical protein